MGTIIKFPPVWANINLYDDINSSCSSTALWATLRILWQLEDLGLPLEYSTDLALGRLVDGH